MEHSNFKFKSITDLEKFTNNNNLNIPISQDISILKKKVDFKDIKMPNSMAILPMEGCDSNEKTGKPEELVARRYKRFAEGGAGLLWFEACAVKEEGKANPRQMQINENSYAAIGEMLKSSIESSKQVYGENHKPYTILQLTHSGRYSKPFGKPKPVIAYNNKYLDNYLDENYRIINDNELDELQNSYVDAAKLAVKAGFDAIDIKSCHGYLLAELLSGYNRPGKYGGELGNRVRFLLETIKKVKDKVGEDISITTRMNAYDGLPYPYGWGVSKEDLNIPDLEEPLKLIEKLKKEGVQMINISIGNPYYNPHVGRAYDSGPYIPNQHPLEGIGRFLNILKGIKDENQDLILVGGGISWLREFSANVAAGCLENGYFDIAGFGRQAFAYPNFAKDIIEMDKLNYKKCCIACSKCTKIMRYGGKTGCVIKDSQVYAPIYNKLEKEKGNQ